ncbi:hypothetical protein ACIPSA_46275 [Streptomyces sp. NPDC086549]|uniref:hypothetical protein n=1 Tax=Streptomyces sp. NPDC086549 TaxID=3365752 RepID=UPI003800FBD7
MLMVFDHSLDGIEDPDNDIHQSTGMVNLAPNEWFAPFDQGRDPERVFRHP